MQGALCTVSVFILHFTYLGVRKHPTHPLPTGLGWTNIERRERTAAGVACGGDGRRGECRDCDVVPVRQTARRRRRTATASPDCRPWCSNCCAGTSEDRPRTRSLAPAPGRPARSTHIIDYIFISPKHSSGSIKYSKRTIQQNKQTKHAEKCCGQIPTKKT